MNTATARHAVQPLLPLLAALLLAVAALLLPPPAAAAGAASTETRYLSVNGERIAYRSLGRGAPIVMVNRLRGTLDTWDPLFLDALARQHRVITVDYPGIGYSQGVQPDDIGKAAAFIGDFATALGLKQFVALGWSWGGLVTQALLLDRPQQVTRAILIGTVPPGANTVPMQQAFLDAAVKPVNDLADEEVLFFEPRSEASRAAAKASHERIYARPGVTEKIPTKPEQLQAYFKAAKGFHADAEDRRGQLSRTRTPILVICGDNDPGTPGQNWFPLMGQLPTAQLLMYPQTGHGPQHQHPELTADYIHRFLARSAR
ncbi:MAG: alpha/beta hydrolase [Stagnimonas sp.]|nr:alpha/beta hydrolase [Stagnimonas sp.]